MSDRTLNWGESASAARYQTGDDDPDGGDFIVARDLDGQRMLLKFDFTANEWQYAGDLDIGGGDLNSVGTARVDAIEADRSVTKETPVLEVDAFGAVGDGTADDTQAIKDAINSVGEDANAVLAFSGAKEYLISERLTIDITRIKGVVGRNARLTLDGDFEGLRLLGNVTDGGGSPGGPQDEREEQFPFIQNLHIRGPDEDPYLGTGIVLENTYGTKIRGCSIYNLDIGLAWEDYNRDCSVHDNSFWDNRNYNIHMRPGHDIHQLKINDNYLGYAFKPIFNEDAELEDMLFQNNLIETGISEQKVSTAHLHLQSLTDGNNLKNNLITGNQFQCHGEVDNALVWFENETANNNCELNKISNNEFTDTGTGDGLRYENGRSLTVTDNEFNNIGGDCVNIIDVERNFKISNNSAWECDNAFSRIKLSGNIGSSSIVNNTISFHSGLFIDYNINGGNLNATSLSDNVVFNLNEPSGPLLEVSGSSDIFSLRVNNNSITCTDGEGAIVIDTSTPDLFTATENIARNFDDTEVPIFDFPAESETVIVRDNINN